MRALPLAAVLTALLAPPAARADDPKPKESPPAQAPDASAPGAEGGPAAAKPPAPKRDPGAKGGAVTPDLKVRATPAPPEKKGGDTKPCEEVRPCSID